MNDFKSKMDEKIRIYSKKSYLDGYIKDEFLTEDGDADIFLNIEKREDLFDSRTSGKQIDLTYEVYDFIEEKTSMLDSNTKINLHITGLYLTPHEQGIVRHLIKEHYAIQLYKIQRVYIRYRNKIVGLITFGLLCFLLYTLLYLLTDFDFFLEVFGFIASFSLWVALECYIYTFSDVKSERISITQNLLIGVDFDNKEKDIY